MVTEDRGKRVRVQGDTEAGTIAQEVRAAVEEEEEGGQGRGAQVQGAEAAAEEEAVITEEAVGPAMGTDEEFAQRPRVMGGLL